MADSFAQADPGSGGPKFAVDIDGAGVEWPYSKVAYGPAGTYTHVADVAGQGLPTKPDPTAIFPVTGVAGSLTLRNGTITVNNASQQVAPANAARKYIAIWNPQDAPSGESIWIRFGAAATENSASWEIYPGGSFFMQSPNFVCTDQLQVIAATAGHAYGCWEG